MLDLQNTYVINSSFYLDRVVLHFSSELANNDFDENNWKLEINGQIFDTSSVVRDPGTSTWNSLHPNIATWNNILKIYVEGLLFNTSDIVKVIYTPSHDASSDLDFLAGNLSGGAPLYFNEVWEAEIASNPFYGHDISAVVDLSTGKILNCIVTNGFVELERYWLPPGPLANGDYPNSMNGEGYLGGSYPFGTDSFWALLVPAKYAGTPGASAVASKYWMGGTVDIALFQIIQNYYEKSNELSLFLSSSAANLNGGTSSDLIYSDSEKANNTINAGFGDDTILSDLFFTKEVGGADTIGAGDGDDLVFSGGGNDVITAGNGNDEVNAGAGNDLIIGGNGAGNDKYFGGPGTDTIRYTSATAAISVDLSTGIVTSRAGGDVAGIGTDTLSDIEDIIAGNFDDILTGNASENRIEAGKGNDTLNGGTGIDTLIGGQGNDTYITDGGDTVTEATSAGTDTVQSSVTYTLGTNLENLSLIGSAAINGTGNTLNNVISGNSGSNALDGGMGNDTLDGGTGADTLIGGAGNDTYMTDGDDTITEAASAGTDTVQSSVTYTLGTNLENLTLTGSVAINGTGNSLNNVITGNSAANILNAGNGNDKMTGGNGNDTFIFNTIAESGTTATATDVITDFVIGQDKIDLSAIDAFAAAGANDTFIWKDTAAFSSTTQGEVRYQKFDNTGTANDYTMIWIDNDADTAVEMAIRLTGLYTLTASDFIL